MLLPERDSYDHDYTVKYYPKVSNVQFYHDMMKNVFYYLNLFKERIIELLCF